MSSHEKDAELSKTISGFELFVDDKLKADLRSVLELQRELYQEISEYDQLIYATQALKDTIARGKKAKTKVDIGCNIYAKAVIHDPSHLFVKMGYGIFAELTLDEAAEFAKLKSTLLDKRAQFLDTEVVRLEGLIQEAGEKISQLMQLGSNAAEAE